MRSSIRFIGSSNERSSRKSEKSKPSSSLTGTKTASSGNAALVGACRASTSTSARRVRRVAGLEEAAPLLGVLGCSGPASRPSKNALAERLGRLAAEQQLGGLGPLRDGALAVGEDEPAADDLLEQPVERVVVTTRRLGGVGGACGGVDCLEAGSCDVQPA